jgi:hypothetical protein
MAGIVPTDYTIAARFIFLPIGRGAQRRENVDVLV